MENTKRTKTIALTDVYGSIKTWEDIINREKGIYYTLNKLSYDHKRKCLIGEGWCPFPQFEYISRSLKTTKDSKFSMSSIITPMRITSSQIPPTFNANNKFTQGFQNIIDSYGVPTYGEVNPALFTIISFPFLFAIMFGDFGHGFILMLAALYLVVNEKKFMNANMGEVF